MSNSNFATRIKMPVKTQFKESFFNNTLKFQTLFVLFQVILKYRGRDKPIF